VNPSHLRDAIVVLAEIKRMASMANYHHTTMAITITLKNAARYFDGAGYAIHAIIAAESMIYETEHGHYANSNDAEWKEQ
jgi:hypothetical protein